MKCLLMLKHDCTFIFHLSNLCKNFTKTAAADGRGTICLLGARRDWYVSVGTYSMRNYVEGRTKEERRDGIYAPLGGLNK